MIPSRTPSPTPPSRWSCRTERVVARTPTQLAFARLRRDRGAVVSVERDRLDDRCSPLAAPLVACWTGHPVNEQYRDTGLTEFGLPVGPRAEFWFGTDQLGRDLLVRLAYGARVSMLVGAVSTDRGRRGSAR